MGWGIVVMDIQLPIQSVHITVNIVSLNPAHDELYSIQHDVIKFFSHLRQVGGFLHVLRFLPPIILTFTILLSLFRFPPCTPVSSSNNTDLHDITEFVYFRSLHVEYFT